MNESQGLKKYEKPVIEVYGDAKEITKGAEAGQEDGTGYFV